MVITVKNFELRNIAEALSKIDTKNLKVSTGFKVAKLVKTFSEALTEFSEASTEIQKEYVKKDAEGNYIRHKSVVEKADGTKEEVETNEVEFDNIPELNAKLVELSNVEIEVTTPVFLSSTEFDEAGLRLDLQTLFILEPLFKD